MRRAGETPRWQTSDAHGGKPLKLGGNAWQYLVDNVGCGHGEGAKATSYLAGRGTPPGKFVGKGLPGLGPHPSAVKAGDVVSPGMLYRMLVQLADPVTGQPLGRRPCAAKKAPVAGYDLTFSVPKSLSLIWAMGDEQTRAGAQECWNASVAEVVALDDVRAASTELEAGHVAGKIVLIHCLPSGCAGITPWT